MEEKNKEEYGEIENFRKCLNNIKSLRKYKQRIGRIQEIRSSERKSIDEIMNERNENE